MFTCTTPEVLAVLLLQLQESSVEERDLTKERDRRRERERERERERFQVIDQIMNVINSTDKMPHVAVSTVCLLFLPLLLLVITRVILVLFLFPMSRSSPFTLTTVPPPAGPNDGLTEITLGIPNQN